MTYQGDPNRNDRRTYAAGGGNYASWIIGAIIVVLVVVGIFAYTGTNTSNNGSASNTAPTTTGSGNSPAPAGKPAAPATGR